jgi:hypothetical protein
MGMGRPDKAPTVDEQEVARREAAVIEAARRWGQAYHPYLANSDCHDCYREVIAARKGLLAAVASLEEITGPLPEVQP